MDVFCMWLVLCQLLNRSPEPVLPADHAGMHRAMSEQRHLDWLLTCTAVYQTELRRMCSLDAAQRAGAVAALLAALVFMAMLK